MSQAFAKKLYNSKKWQLTRDYIFKKYNGLCVECGRPGEEVHHIIHLTQQNINDPAIAFGEDNLQLLCKDCHFEKHRLTNPLNNNFRHKTLTDNGYYFDEQGQMQQCKRYIVHGSPGSGKLTYVEEHKLEGDLVVDFDVIGQALSNSNNTPFNLLPTVHNIREHLYQEITDGKVDAKNIWVIASLPNRKERKTLAKRLKADLIHIDTDMEQCIANIMNDESRIDKENQIEIIKRYHSKKE